METQGGDRSALEHSGRTSLRWRVPFPSDREALEGLIPFREPPEGGREIKRSRSRLVIRLRLGDGRMAYVKRYKVKSRARQAASWCYPSKVEREYSVCRAAEQQGLPVAPVIGAAEVRQSGLLVESYIAHEAVEPAVSLQDLLRDPQAELAPLDRQGLLKAAARFLVRMQEGGLEHDDFQSSHVLVRRPMQHAPEFALIDLDGARLRGRPLGRRAVIRHLVQLNRSLWGKAPSPRERLQFLRELIKVHPRLEGLGVGRLWRRIVLQSALRWGKKSRVERAFYAGAFLLSGQVPRPLRGILKEG